MVNKKDIRKMRVWNDNAPVKRYVLYKVPLGYLAITKNTEASFEAGRSFATKIWENAEEIKEEWKPFEKIPLEYFNYYYRTKGKREVVYKIYKPEAIAEDKIKLNGCWWNLEELFIKWEVSKDNCKSWQQIGIKNSIFLRP